MTELEYRAWMHFWPRVGNDLAKPGQPTPRGTIPDTQGMRDVYDFLCSPIWMPVLAYPGMAFTLMS